MNVRIIVSIKWVPIMAYTDPHRGVTISVNLQNEVDYMVTQLARLIAQVEGKFKGPDNLTMKVAKQWYGIQLVDPDTGFTYGFLHFTVSNRTLFDKSIAVDDKTIESKELVYSLHLKQNETIALANNFVSASIYFSSRRGDLESHKVDFNLYGGSDAECAILFRDFVAKIKPQIEAFNADNVTLSMQSELDLIPLLTFGANGTTY